MDLIILATDSGLILYSSLGSRWLHVDHRSLWRLLNHRESLSLFGLDVHYLFPFSGLLPFFLGASIYKFVFLVLEAKFNDKCIIVICPILLSFQFGDHLPF